MAYEDNHSVLPGDTLTLKEPLTVISADFYGDIETEEDINITSDNLDLFEVEKQRPANWPPQTHDVWRIDHEHLHCLGDELRDEDGDDVDLADFLTANGYSVMNLKLVFRPGVKEAK